MLNSNWEFLLMHRDSHVATIRKDGTCEIILPSFMPYNLFFNANTESLDDRVNNLANFYYWCSSRVLSLDRKHAKIILNVLGKKQSVTDRDRAEISISYHCLTLTDVYWIKTRNEDIKFSDISLYKNSLSNAFVDVSLRGENPTINNLEFFTQRKVADDVATSGVAPKAWVRKKDGIYLYKDGDISEVNAELLASKIVGCFKCDSVNYFEEYYCGEKTSASRLITSEEKSIVAMEFIEVYAVNNDTDKYSIIMEKDPYNYYMMNIMDYLVGNTDRHWGNWGFYVDNKTNNLMKLYPLMDFNKSFTSYDTIDGSKCLTTKEPHTQKQAAIEAVKKVGLNKIKKIEDEWFYNDSIKEMFYKRLKVLEQQ